MRKVMGVILLSAIFAVPSYAIKLRDADIDFGIQYRVMYNNSNIQSNNQYDFFRQRLRLNFDVKTESGVGGFLQIEYRGGWGGSSPGPSLRTLCKIYARTVPTLPLDSCKNFAYNK